MTASLVNAVQGHAIDMDDGHRFANGHPGVVTVPAAVATAERENSSGRELIEAVVAGYEKGVEGRKGCICAIGRKILV